MRTRTKPTARRSDEMLEPCPGCGAAVEMAVASGGTRYEKTMYSVECPLCGPMLEDCIPSNCSGRRADAVKEWNQWAKTWKNEQQKT
jgi:endogenous inhibitor of DNA gyrase (YacG/DUF329 family)